MVTITRWTGLEALTLRKALRMSVRTFAAHTNLSVSSVADMEAKGEQAHLRHVTQQLLDEVLATASEPARQRFSALLAETVRQTANTATDAGTTIAAGSELHADHDTALERAGASVGPLAVLAGSDGLTAESVGLVHARDHVRLTGRVDEVDGIAFQEFLMAAEESARFTRRAGATVSAELLEQIRSEVRALALAYVRRPPYAVFAPISALRREVFSILDAHVPAQHLSDLYLYAGQLTALLAHASADLGQPVTAEAHARTAWLCAELAGHDPLRAYVRWVEANIAYWAGQYRQAAQLAADGRRHATSGSTLLRLASQEARGWAACGDQRAVERALSAARDERDRLPGQISEVGAFHFGSGKAAYYASEAWLAVGGTDNARRARNDGFRAAYRGTSAVSGAGGRRPARPGGQPSRARRS